MGKGVLPAPQRRLMLSLGHEDVRTTQRYTHVSNRDIGRIRSPLDNLTLKKDGGVYEVIEVEVPF